MTPADFKEARHTLGLTAAELARIMGYGAAPRIYEIETAFKVPAQAARLMQAYLDGYRPGDWVSQAHQEVRP